ncbi:hypothetical protein GA0070611_2415 [Micromonospora auratinigra]|uniref:Fibronectin type-III domain-containing protein n=1 Tax=Micromonospora auratinigra TaxID=261654 RepID=A0A1A8ZIH4_9ACTN|nr:hypothetical protein GA0070611_2415 [Micromonospora auratinigra]
MPPWGLTAPPWSSAAPSQPVERAAARPEPEVDREDEADRGPVDPTVPPERDPDDGRPRPLTVYDELLEFPESTRPEPGPETYPEQQGVWPDVPAPFHQPPAYPVDLDEESEPRGRNRTVLVVAIGAAVVAVVAAIAVGVVVLNRDAAPAPGPAPVSGPVKPKVSGPPPGDLKLRDDGTRITVTWTDPSQGTVPFMVAGGQAGRTLQPLITMEAGSTSYTVNGMSTKLNYCFTVLAVYSTDTVATSGQVCTDRQGVAPN